jgi:hypothetical protein
VIEDGLLGLVDLSNGWLGNRQGCLKIGISISILFRCTDIPWMHRKWPSSDLRQDRFETVRLKELVEAEREESAVGEFQDP